MNFKTKLLSLSLFAVLTVFMMPSAVGASSYVPITLRVDRNQTRLETSARTVEAFLAEQEIELYYLDEINVHMGRRIEHNLTIEIRRARYANISINGQLMEVRVPAAYTINDIIYKMENELEEELIPTGSFARQISHSLDLDREISTRDQLIFYTRHSNIETYSEPIPYEHLTLNNPNIEYGEEYLYQTGVEGTRSVYVEVTYFGGTEYSRVEIDEVIVSPVAQIIHVGTYVPEVIDPFKFILGELFDTSHPNFRYARRMSMEAVAYTRYFCCTRRRPGDPGFGITANGTPLEHGIVAVDPNVIPLGTKLYVEGYGFALAADVGGSIRGYKIDLYKPTVEDAFRWGRRTVEVFVLYESL